MNSIRAEKNKERAKIAAEIRKYLRGGGKIEKVKTGASAYIAEIRIHKNGRKRFVIDSAKKKK